MCLDCILSWSHKGYINLQILYHYQTLFSLCIKWRCMIVRKGWPCFWWKLQIEKKSICSDKDVKLSCQGGQLFKVRNSKMTYQKFRLPSPQGPWVEVLESWLCHSHMSFHIVPSLFGRLGLCACWFTKIKSLMQDTWESSWVSTGQFFHHTQASHFP